MECQQYMHTHTHARKRYNHNEFILDLKEREFSVKILPWNIILNGIIHRFDVTIVNGIGIFIGVRQNVQINLNSFLTSLALIGCLDFTRK